jgi:hypothetical protein
MLGADARRLNTEMIKLQVVRDRPVLSLPHNDVSASLLAGVVNHVPVAVQVQVPRDDPARSPEATILDDVEHLPPVAVTPDVTLRLAGQPNGATGCVGSDGCRCSTAAETESIGHPRVEPDLSMRFMLGIGDRGP